MENSNYTIRPQFAKLTLYLGQGGSGIAMIGYLQRLQVYRSEEF